MRRSIATVSMSGTLRQKLQAIAAARFDGIELFEADFVNFDGSATAPGTPYRITFVLLAALTLATLPEVVRMGGSAGHQLRSADAGR